MIARPLGALFRRRVRTATLATLALSLVVFVPAAASAAGDLDPSFSGDGKATTDFGGVEDARGVARQPDGKLVAAGRACVAGNCDFAVARYTSSGALDTTFSGDGRALTDFGSPSDAGQDVAVQADGKIVVVGVTAVVVDPQAGATTTPAIARYNPDGSPDATFSGDGRVVRTPDGPVSHVATAVAVQADGKIVVTGFTGDRIRTAWLARYDPNGALDFEHFGFADFPQSEAHAVAVQSGGKIVIAGVSGGQQEPDGDFLLVRFNPDGSLDRQFGASGVVTTDFAGDERAGDVGIQGDGRIVAAGTACPGGDFSLCDFALARYTSTGTLDGTFSGDGRQTTDIGKDDFGNGLGLQPDGRLVAAGTSCEFVPETQATTACDSAVARYTTSGGLDTTFSGDGKTTTDFGGSEVAADLAVQPDGRSVVAGRALGDFAVARYEAAGPYLFFDDFELGNLSRWSFVDGFRVQSEHVRSGSFGGRSTASGSPAYAVGYLGTAERDLYYRFWFKPIRRTPGGIITLA